MVKPSLPHRRAAGARAVLILVGLAICLALVARPVVVHGRQNPGQQAQGPGTPLEDLVRLADEVAKEVEALRGWNFKQPVAKQLATPEQVARYIERSLATSLPAGETAIVEAMLRTIGLIPRSCNLKATYLALMENQVAGFYDPDTRTMNLVQRPGSTPPIVERMMLAHELTHALDDQYADLASLVKPAAGSTEDSDLVASSVGEGSATALMLQYMVRAQAAGRVNLSELTQYAAQEAERSKPFLEAPRYFTTILATYICGTQFLAKGDLMSLVLAPDNRAIGANLLAARKDLPRSTEQILHPKKYWDAAERDEPVRMDDQAAATWLARPGRWIVHADTIGELLTAVLTTPKDKAPNLAAMQTADAWTSPAARGWGGDRFFLLASGATRTEAAASLTNLQGAWITAWDTAADRDEFVASLTASALPATAVAAPIGALAAVVFVGFDEAERAALVRRLAEEPLPMTRDGKNWSPAGR